MEGSGLDALLPGWAQAALAVGGVIAGMAGWMWRSIKLSPGGASPEFIEGRPRGDSGPFAFVSHPRARPGVFAFGQHDETSHYRSRMACCHNAE